MLSAAQDLLHDRFGLSHVTVQVEPAEQDFCRLRPLSRPADEHPHH